MVVLLMVAVVLLIVYALLIRFYERAWHSIPPFQTETPTSDKGLLTVTVIVPARNEEKNIGACLQSLLAQKYPASVTQIIVVNDFSTDSTETIVRSYQAENVQLINLRDVIMREEINSYKKKAIETAIGFASGELIITTDADCVAPAGWIEAMVSFQQAQRAAFIAAPVRIVYNHTFLGLFQSLDFLTLQGITGAAVFKKAHSMCNGANLAYLRKAFVEVDGFRGIDNIASGDDMLLMHKIATRYSEQYFFLKDRRAIVDTQPAITWKEFFHQRIRWASKAGKYDDRRITGVLALVYLLNVLLFVLLVLALFQIKYLLYFLFLVAGKTLVEYRFVQAVARFFEQEKLLRYFLFLQPLHIAYTVIAGFLGKFGRYEWKRRKVR